VAGIILTRGNAFSSVINKRINCQNTRESQYTCVNAFLSVYKWLHIFFLVLPGEEHRNVLDPKDMSERKTGLTQWISEIVKLGIFLNNVPSGYCELGTGHKAGWLLRSFTGGYLP